MKKLLAIILSLALLFVLAACNEKEISSENNGGSSNSAASESAEFEKPENYASVLLVTINPQFRLYLDSEGKVLAVEAVNEDAKTIKADISFENENFEKVVEKIVSKANESGFITENTTIDFEITESKNPDADTADILNKAVTTAKQTATTLDIKVSVNAKDTASESAKTEQENNTSSGKATAEENNSSVNSKKSETTTSAQQQSAHIHKFASATCTAAKKCSCGATEGSALGHSYENGTCKRCGAKDPDYVSYTAVTKKSGTWSMRCVSNNTLYDAVFTLCGSAADYGVSVGYGDPFSGLPEDFQEEIRAEGGDSYVVFNGAEYYIGRGDGDSISAVNETDGTVTLIDASGNKLVLTRTAENTLKVKSSPNEFVIFDKIPVGTELKFTAE